MKIIFMYESRVHYMVNLSSSYQKQIKIKVEMHFVV